MNTVATAQKIRKGEFAGTGAAVQAVGLVVLIIGLIIHWIFFPVGLALMIIGGRLAFKFLCGACGNRVEKTSRMCPHCHVYLQ